MRLVMRGGVPRYRLWELNEVELYPVEFAGRKGWIEGEEAEPLSEPDEEPLTGERPARRRWDGTPAVTFDALQDSLARRCAKHPRGVILLSLDAAPETPAPAVLAAWETLRPVSRVGFVAFGTGDDWPGDPVRPVVRRYFADGRFTATGGRPIAPVTLRSGGACIVDLPTAAARQELETGVKQDELLAMLEFHAARMLHPKNRRSGAVMLVRISRDTPWGRLQQVMLTCARAGIARVVVRVER